MEATTVHEPPMQSSDEATQEQLALARGQGRALQRAIDTLIREVAHGIEQRAGDYLIGYAVEKAEGLYFLREGTLRWEEPQEENVHVEIAVRDGADGRFIPGLTVYATLIGPDENVIGTHRQPFLWHPWLYHYGRNWKAPQSGTYTLCVRVEVPDFPRHDKKNGLRYAAPVEVTFTDVQINPGRK